MSQFVPYLVLSSDAFSLLVSASGKGIWSGDNEKRMVGRLREAVWANYSSNTFSLWDFSICTRGKKGRENEEITPSIDAYTEKQTWHRLWMFVFTEKCFQNPQALGLRYCLSWTQTFAGFEKSNLPLRTETLQWRFLHNNPVFINRRQCLLKYVQLKTQEVDSQSNSRQAGDSCNSAHGKGLKALKLFKQASQLTSR